jgi:hypothetical protein
MLVMTKVFYLMWTVNAMLPGGGNKVHMEYGPLEQATCEQIAAQMHHRPVIRPRCEERTQRGDAQIITRGGDQ